MKRVVVIADLHCGHRVGLTPPGYQEGQRTLRDKHDHKTKFLNRCAASQKECWMAYKAIMADLQPIHLLIVNGDAIDGRGEKSGGTELITGDRDEQCSMAVESIMLAKAKHIAMCYGTAYHAGQEEDWEDQIARRVKADKIGSHEWPSVNGLIFDVKHFVGSSSIPHGRATAVKREALWNTIWAEARKQPQARVIVRSHVHYFEFNGNVRQLCMTTPALQAMGTKFGARKCSGIVDWGVTYFDVDKDGYYKHEWCCPPDLTCQVAKEDKY